MHIARATRQALVLAAVVGPAAALGCDQNRAAHASPSHAQESPAEGFCTEAPASPSASSCTCEAPLAPHSPSAAASSSPPVVESSRAVPDGSMQLLLVTTPGWNDFQGQARRFERQTDGWHQVGEAMAVALGRRGMAWGRGLHPDEGRKGPIKHEGDMKSPAGVFDLASAYGYAPVPPPGTTWPYRRLTLGWKCIDDPRNINYNTMNLPEAPFAPAPTVPWGGVRRDIVFDMFVQVKHNTDPVQRSGGSCVLLHPWINAATPTQGCTSFAKADLQTVLAWLSPNARPVLVQLPQDEWKAVGQAWGAPAGH